MTDPLDRLSSLLAAVENTRCTCEIDISPLPYCAACEARDVAFSKLTALAPKLARCALALSWMEKQASALRANPFDQCSWDELIEEEGAIDQARDVLSALREALAEEAKKL